MAINIKLKNIKTDDMKNIYRITMALAFAVQNC